MKKTILAFTLLASTGVTCTAQISEAAKIPGMAGNYWGWWWWCNISIHTIVGLTTCA